MENLASFKNLELVECPKLEESVTLEIGYQPLLEREVMIKRLTASAGRNPLLRGRFIKEARTLASLDHPYIVRVYDAGLDDNGLPYMILEKPEGTTVQQRLHMLAGQRARMDIEEVEQIIRQVCEAVTYSHRHNVLIHDLSPANLVLTRSGRTVITGLGQPLSPNLLNAPAMALAYASPERLLGQPVNQQSDVYSLGVLLYQLLFGHLPFEGNALGIIGQKHSATSLPLLDDPGIKLPQNALVRILRRATARQASDRYEDVTAFRTAVAAVLDTKRMPDRVGLRSPFEEQSGTPVEFEAREIAAGGRFVPRDMPVMATVASAVPAAMAANGHNGMKATGHTATWNGRNGAARNGRASYHDAQPSGGTRAATVPVHSAPRDNPPVERAGGDEVGSHAAVDPLVPGQDDPTLQAAIPYTTLVTTERAAEEAQDELAALSSRPVKAPTAYMWLLWLGGLGLLAVLAATWLG